MACLCFLASGLWALLSGLGNLAEAQSAYTLAIPWVAWNRDWTIVFLCAEFTVALIPVIWIFLIARPLARVMVTVFGLWKLWALSSSSEFNELVQIGLISLSILLLFAPDAHRWFEERRL